MAALAGTNLIYGLRMIESGVTFDCAQLVIDDEIARLVKLVIGGIRAYEARLAVDDIARLGAFGDFLSLDATDRRAGRRSRPPRPPRRAFTARPSPTPDTSSSSSWPWRGARRRSHRRRS